MAHLAWCDLPVIVEPDVSNCSVSYPPRAPDEPRSPGPALFWTGTRRVSTASFQYRPHPRNNPQFYCINVARNWPGPYRWGCLNLWSQFNDMWLTGIPGLCGAILQGSEVVNFWSAGDLPGATLVHWTLVKSHKLTRSVIWHCTYVQDELQ